MIDIIEHYDNLIEEGNDPFRDPEPLREYMNKWDGDLFIEKMNLDKTKTVLEIGVGTGRLAIKVAPLCKSFLGIDISPKTIERAHKNLSPFDNIELCCDEFLTHRFSEKFDIIYSSLTFMHIEAKQEAICKVSTLLQDDGVFVLSLDKSQSRYIDTGTRKIKVYPDSLSNIKCCLANAKLFVADEFETEFANIIVCKKASLV